MLFPRSKIKNGKVIKGAFSLAAAAFIAKLIGAFYRIPLTNILKSEGIGLYQMVFPVYTLLLELSGAGIPAALSALISGYTGGDKNEYAVRIMKNAIKIFAVVGVCGTAALFAVCKPLSDFQGNSSAVFGYLFMAPAVFFTAVISCYRGYFQGLMNMTPTAISQILEQAVKALFGLTLVIIFMPNVMLAVGGATLAVSISEAAAYVYLNVIYRKKNKNSGCFYDKNTFSNDFKAIIKLSVPVTLMGMVLPVSHVLDSFFIVNVLNSNGYGGTALYGLISGAASTVINLPVSLCYAISVTAIPVVSGAKFNSDKKEKEMLFITVAFSLFFALLCYFAAPVAVGVLFRSLSATDKEITVKLIKILSGNVFFISVLQTVNSIHVARKTPYKTLLGLIFGVIIKLTLFPSLLNSPLNVYGGAACIFACYFSACLINLLLLIKLRVKNGNEKPFFRKVADQK